MAKPESQAGGLEARIGRAVASLYRWLPRNRVTRIPWAVIQTFSHAQGALLSGSMAYYTFLSLLPLLMVTGFVIGTISLASAGIRDALAGAIGDLFPGVEGRRIVNQLIGARVAFGVFGTIALIYSGTGFVGALTASLNRIWGVSAGRDPLRQKLVNLLVVVLLGVVLLASVGLTAWVSHLTRAAFGTRGSGLVRFIDFTASPLSLLGVLLLLYRLLPRGRCRCGPTFPGPSSGQPASRY